MTINSQLLWISFPKFVKVVERAKVVCHRFEGAPHAVALYLTGNFNTESGGVNEAWKSGVLYWIGMLTNLHLSIVAYIMVC